MNFLVRNLHLTIVFYFHFRESNSVGIDGAGSSTPTLHYNNPHENIPPLIIHYKGSDIEVSFHILSGQLKPKNCQVLGEHYGVPTRAEKKNINFITRALMHGGKQYCVVYETGNGKVLGVKLPPIFNPNKWTSYTGDPRDFNPSESQCFMTYNGLDLLVLGNPVTGNASSMRLLPDDANPNSTYILKYDVIPIHVEFGGLHFILYQRQRVNGKPDWKIVAAALDPDWRNRVPQLPSG